MKKLYILILLLSSFLFAQESLGGLPYSFSANVDGEVTSILSTCSHYGSIFGDILLICVVMNVNDFSNMQAADDAEELSFFDIYDLPELAFYCHNKFINEYKKEFSKKNNL